MWVRSAEDTTHQRVSHFLVDLLPFLFFFLPASAAAFYLMLLSSSIMKALVILQKENKLHINTKMRITDKLTFVWLLGGWGLHHRVCWRICQCVLLSSIWQGAWLSRRASLFQRSSFWCTESRACHQGSSPFWSGLIWSCRRLFSCTWLFYPTYLDLDVLK